jgi:hypothetical protein
MRCHPERREGSAFISAMPQSDFPVGPATRPGGSLLPARMSENQQMICLKLLGNAIEGLYSAFSKYPLPDQTCPCPCCHPTDVNALLHAAPLRKLQWQHLAGYSTEALMVWGDSDCYKHFLPRIFELVVTDGERFKSPDPERVFGILRYGEWRTWPKAEQDAIELFLLALWEAVLKDPPLDGTCPDMESWICAISQSEDDLTPYLRQWEKDESHPACLALSGFLLNSAITRSKKHGRNEFWADRDTQYVQLQNWVKSTVVREKLTRASEKWPEIDEFTAAISIAQ